MLFDMYVKCYRVLYGYLIIFETLKRLQFDVVVPQTRTATGPCRGGLPAGGPAGAWHAQAPGPAGPVARGAKRANRAQNEVRGFPK